MRCPEMVGICEISGRNLVNNSGVDPMAHRHHAERLGRPIRGIREGARPFGGVAVVFGGDCRQIPPIVRRGSRAHVVASSLKRFPIWRAMRKRVLTRTLRRLDGEEEFADYMIEIEDGSVAIADGEAAIAPHLRNLNGFVATRWPRRRHRAPGIPRYRDDVWR